MKVVEEIIEEHLRIKIFEVAEEMNFERSSIETEQSPQNKQYYSQ